MTMTNTRILGESNQPLPDRIAPRKTPRQQRSKELVDSIVEAGARILCEQGWESLTMQAVSERAGVSPGSLYQYFAHKRALLAEIIERLSQREVEFYLDRMSETAPDLPLEQKIVALLRAGDRFRQFEGGLLEASLPAFSEIGRHAVMTARVERVKIAFNHLMIADPENWSAEERRTMIHVLMNAIHALTHEGVLPAPPDLPRTEIMAELEVLVCAYLSACRSRR